MTNFNEAAQHKFVKGQIEHGDWSDIDPVTEISHELIDLYWYASHPKFENKILGGVIQTMAKIWWERLNETQKGKKESLKIKSGVL